MLKDQISSAIEREYKLYKLSSPLEFSIASFHLISMVFSFISNTVFNIFLLNDLSAIQSRNLNKLPIFHQIFKKIALKRQYFRKTVERNRFDDEFMHKLNVNCLLNKRNVNRCLLETLGSELSVGLIGFT